MSQKQESGSAARAARQMPPGPGDERGGRSDHGQPRLGQRARELQPYGEVTRRLPVGLY